jgi:hypothetical protein
LPELDDRFDLLSGRMAGAAAPRLPAEQLATEDWHNKHAAFVLDLRQYLASLKSNADRERLLADLQSRLKKRA